MSAERTIGIAISGGGHRATAFGLGALLAVVDARLNESVVSVSSVSGGSIANAAAMTGNDFGTASAAEFEEQIRPTLRAVASNGLLLGGAKATKWYVRSLFATAGLAVVGLLAGVVVAFIGATNLARVLLLLGLVMLLVAWRVLRQRSAQTGKAIEAEMFGSRHVTLADVQAKKSSVHHVICTTELQSGEPCYFTNRGVWQYRFGGSTTPSSLPLSTAVQASACVPGAFAPQVIPVATLGLKPHTITTKQPGKADSTTVLSNVILDDGGVYDNMADEWEYGYANRARNWPALAAEIQPDRAGYLVVVNGSAGWDQPKPIGRSGIAQELAGLLRAQGVQYDVSTTHRRRALASMFRAEGERRSDEIDGILAQISKSPYDLPDDMCSAKLQNAGPPTAVQLAIAARADKAIAFLDAQGYNREQWAQIVDRNRHVKTTLAKISVPTTAELAEHGYVLAMTVLFVLDNKCPLKSIDRERFVRLCQ